MDRPFSGKCLVSTVRLHSFLPSTLEITVILNVKLFSFSDHFVTCKQDKQFVCDKCGFRTHTSRKLKSHQLVHTAEREQKRELSRLNNVARAEEKRINPRNFPCDFPMCNKVSSNSHADTILKDTILKNVMRESSKIVTM